MMTSYSWFLAMFRLLEEGDVTIGWFRAQGNVPFRRRTILRNCGDPRRICDRREHDASELAGAPRDGEESVRHAEDDAKGRSKRSK